MELTTEDIDNYAVNNTRKIAGQSLTEDPSTPPPYLKAPKFTGKEEAINYFFDYITDEERFTEIMEILEEGVPVMDVVQLILMHSFEKGEINPEVAKDSAIIKGYTRLLKKVKKKVYLKVNYKQLQNQKMIKIIQ